MAWFSLNNSGDPTNPEDYTISATQPSCDPGNNQICAIQADADANDQPELTDEVKDEMITALHNRASSATVRLKP